MKPRTPKTFLIEMARRAKRAGYPFETVANVKPEFKHLIPEMRDAYDNTRRRV